MNTNNTPEEKDNNPIQQDEQKALEEIWAIRNANYDRIHSRASDFDTNDLSTPLSEIPMHTQMNVIHPDGATAVPITNAQEFLDAFLDTYSDGHGDFGLYESPQEADMDADEERMRQEFEYIMEMQERAGIEFDDYEEAREWELAEQQDPRRFTEDEQLQYIMELEERADCAFNDLEEAMEWERTHCGEYDIEPDEAYESELMEEGTQLTVKDSNEKQTAPFDDNDKLNVMSEIMQYRAINELEDALKVIAAGEIIDEAQVSEIEMWVFDLARRAGIEDLKKYGFDLER